MSQVAGRPSVRELIAEYAAIEDRVRVLEAAAIGGSPPQPDPELARLADRERRILALLRHDRTVADGAAGAC